MLQPYAEQSEIRVSPRYGVWDMAAMGVAPSEAETVGLVLPPAGGPRGAVTSGPTVVLVDAGPAAGGRRAAAALRPSTSTRRRAWSSACRRRPPA